MTDAAVPYVPPRVQLLGIGSVALLAALGWVYLGLMTVAMMGEGDTLGRALYAAICGTRLGAAAEPITFAGTLLVFGMWVAMVLAMMLPSAGPMIVAYGEIVEASARPEKPVVSPLVLTAGYIAVWLGFAVVATTLQTILTYWAMLDASMTAASALFAGAVLIAAGLYQFSELKRACVTQCQQPSPFFRAHWSETSRGVFRLGARQGLYCVGCCFAMMLVMFAVGVMNVVWMAVLGATMTIEKVSTTTRFSRIIGAVLIVVGAAVIAIAVLARLPANGVWASGA